jgi:hypothetical protein
MSEYKAWEEMIEAEREELLCPTKEVELPDGTTKRIRKQMTDEEWKKHILPYYHHMAIRADMELTDWEKNLQIGALECEVEKLQLDFMGAFEIIKAASASTEFLLTETGKAAQVFLEKYREPRVKGGYKRHESTNKKKAIAKDLWFNKPEEERKQYGAKAKFAREVQARFTDEDGKTFPEEERTVYGWIKLWEE